MKLFSKDKATSLISSMIKSGRLSHAYIICGEKGVGKKTLALHMAEQILCEAQSGEPCGLCKSCRMLSHNAHPDFITVTPSGKSGNYRADDLRPIISDANISPNEGERKIYFLPDIDRALPAAQNVLLKIVEEPPSHVIFIMTAESREKILPTVLSRALTLNIPEPTESECLEALTESGYERPAAEAAVSVFGGNIGRCKEYLSDDGAKALPEAFAKVSDALLRGDEYALLTALSPLDKDRDLCLGVLSALKDFLRDALAVKFGGKLCSLGKERAAELSKKLRQSAVEKMYDDISLAEIKINGNSQMSLTLCDLCGRLSSER